MTFLLLLSPLLKSLSNQNTSIKIKIEEHTKKTEPEYQGDVLAVFSAKAAATEHRRWHILLLQKVKIKMTLLLPHFCLHEVLITCQQSAQESET